MVESRNLGPEIEMQKPSLMSSAWAARSRRATGMVQGVVID